MDQGQHQGSGHKWGEKRLRTFYCRILFCWHPLQLRLVFCSPAACLCGLTGMGFSHCFYHGHEAASSGTVVSWLVGCRQLAFLKSPLAKPFHSSPLRPLNLMPVSLGALGQILAGKQGIYSSWRSWLPKELCSMSCGGKKSEGYKRSFVENWCCAVARTESNNSGCLFHTASSLSRCVGVWAVRHNGSCFLGMNVTWVHRLFFSHSQNQGKKEQKALVSVQTCKNECTSFRMITESKSCNKVCETGALQNNLVFQTSRA